MRAPDRRWQRDLLAEHNLDAFLVGAICTVLLIRFVLHLTGYPKLGGSGLHVAHMLWGGLLMAAAILIQLTYLGRDSRRWAAVLGGIGFGTFIDEIGKFLTHDNDYFFRPSVAIIYVIFVLIYLATRSLLQRGATRSEYLVNALQELGEAARGDLDPLERDRALALIARSGRTDPLAAGVRDLLLRNDLVEATPPGPVTRLRLGIIAGYRRLAVKPRFVLGLQLFFTGQLVVKMAYLGVTWLGYPDPRGLLHRLQNPLSVTPEGPGFVGTLLLGASLLQAVLVGLGLWKLRTSRLGSFRMFQHSILVSILFAQPFMFYLDQWPALMGLAFNVLVFAALRFMIKHEES